LIWLHCDSDLGSPTKTLRRGTPPISYSPKKALTSIWLASKLADFFTATIVDSPLTTSNAGYKKLEPPMPLLTFETPKKAPVLKNFQNDI
jgi:hypothetical protein